MKKYCLFLIIYLTSYSSLTFSTPKTPPPENELELIKANIFRYLPEFNNSKTITAFSKTAIEGLYQAEIDNSKIIYITKDGKFFIAGDLYQNNQGKAINLTENVRRHKRIESLSNINLNSAIQYKPEKTTRHKVFIFTDTDCYYCQKLHKEINDYLKAGIEINYLAYPRSGIKKRSKTYREMASIWCSSDRAGSMTRAKKGKKVKTLNCDNPVKEHYEFAKLIGVRATPAILFETGELHFGYLPAKQLLKKLNKAVNTN